MKPQLQIVEPTLLDDRGHCRSLLSSFCRAAPELSMRVWADRAAPLDVLGEPNVQVTPWFRRRVRVPQSFLLYRRLLKGPDRIFVSTAGRTDVVLAHWALGRTGDTARMALFMHWLRPTPSRRASLEKVARARPDMRILGSTETVVDILQDCGFRLTRHVPYPVTSQHIGEEAGGSFSHLLYAGAARRDKGFHRVVELVDALAHAGSTVPVVTQTGGDYYDRIDDEVRGDVERLDGIGYAHLRREPGGLDAERYRALYRGAVAVQLYEPADWTDRASGVTLDALAAGAPLLTFQGSWMARQVTRFGAGLAVDPGDPGSWLAGVESLVAGYAEFSAAAIVAGETLAREYSPRRLVDAVLG